MLQRAAVQGQAQEGERGYPGGWLPYGYRRPEDGTVQVVPEEAEVVRRIFAWAAEGKPLPRITRSLRAENVPNKNGGRWHPSTLRGMLNNPFYTGQTNLNSQLIPAKDEAIV